MQRAGEGMQMGIMLSKLRIASDFGNISWSGPRLAQKGMEIIETKEVSSYLFVYGQPDAPSLTGRPLILRGLYARINL